VTGNAITTWSFDDGHSFINLSLDLIEYNVSFNQLSLVGVFFHDGQPLELFQNGQGINLNTGLNFGYEAARPVPEPSTLFLFGAGLIGIVGIGLRRRRRDGLVPA
jgi:hypothetical protein